MTTNTGSNVGNVNGSTNEGMTNMDATNGNTQDDFRMMRTMRSLMAANVPVVLESLPGAGKTSYLNALVEASGGFCHTMVAVNHDPTDFGGIPVPDLNAGSYKLLAGQWAHNIAAAVNGTEHEHDDGRTCSTAHALVVLFLDEVNTASRAVLASLLKTVDERRVGNFRLPDAVRIVMALNPAEANGGVDLPPAMANRSGHVPFDIPLATWADGLRNGFPLPEPLVIPADDDIVTALRSIVETVADFATARGSDFERYPADPAARSKAWTSRRSWTHATRAMATARALGYGRDTEADILTAMVGRTAADEYMDYATMRELANPRDILADANGWDIPARDDVLFATLDAVTSYAIGSGNAADIANACVVFGRVADEGKAGVAATSIPTLAAFLRSNRAIVTPEMVATLRKFQAILDASGGMDDAFGGAA